MRNRLAKKKLIIRLFCFSLLLFTYTIIATKTTLLSQQSSNNSSSKERLSNANYDRQAVFTPAPKPAPIPNLSLETNLNFFSKQVLVYDLTTKKNIFQQLSNQPHAPASLAKIMAALVAIENLEDLNQEVAIPNDIFQFVHKRMSSLAGFKQNEVVTVRDLLYGSVLASGGEATEMLARIVAGDQINFIAKMNQRALELGLSNTHFESASGFDVANQYTTAEDVAKLLETALQNQLFRQIFTTQNYIVTAKNGRTWTIEHTMLSKINTNPIGEFTILGGKTGTTQSAGVCWASLITSHDRELIVVTMGVPVVNWNSLPFEQARADLELILNRLAISN